MSDPPAVKDPERAVALAYAPRDRRAGLAALWSLDETLAGLVQAGREPMIAQMRLTWWHDALTRLDEGVVPVQPLLRAIAADVIPHGVTGAALATMIEGWEVLLDNTPLTDALLDGYAQARGGSLFRAAATVLGGTDSDLAVTGGRGWALIDLGLHLTSADERRRSFDLARATLAAVERQRWPVAMRPLGMGARLAWDDARAGPEAPRRQGSPVRLARMFRHRLTGR